MNVQSLFSHAHSQSASPFAASAAKPQSSASSGAHAADTTSSTAGSSGSSSSSSSASTDNTATITANDFLTLLVTEIQNQDPTSQTDPMTYITQLVGVNSLEQLVDINQTLSTGVPTTPETSSTSAPSTSTGDSQTSNSPAANSAAARLAIQSSQSTSGPAAAAGGHLLPLGASGQVTSASTNAVAQAFTHPAVTPQHVAPPTQVPLNPDVMRALERSIPGATLAAPATGAR